MRKLPKKFLEYFNDRKNKEFFFLFSLILVFITIPLPKYSLNSQAIVLLVFSWLLLSTIREKLYFLKKNLKLILVLSAPFWIHLIGLYYTNNFYEGITEISKQLPFLLFPILFCSINFRFLDKQAISNYFPIGVFVAILFAVLKALYFFIHNLGNYFYYDQFALLINKHTTYFSLFVCVSLLLTVNNLKIKKNIFLNCILLFSFLITLYFLSVRISVIALSIIIIFTTWNYLNKWMRFTLLVFIPLVVFGIFSSPNFQKRFEPSDTEETSMDDLYFRKLHWQSVVQTILEKPIIGYGTEGNRNSLIQKYKDKKLTAGYQEEYNAHNQLLEYGLDFGLIGMLIMLFCTGIIIKHASTYENDILIQLISIFIIFSLTESIFVRHSGIVMYSLFTSFFIPKLLKNDNS